MPKGQLPRAKHSKAKNYPPHPSASILSVGIGLLLVIGLAGCSGGSDDQATNPEEQASNPEEDPTQEVASSVSSLDLENAVALFISTGDIPDPVATATLSTSASTGVSSESEVAILKVTKDNLVERARFLDSNGAPMDIERVPRDLTQLTPQHLLLRFNDSKGPWIIQVAGGAVYQVEQLDVSSAHAYIDGQGYVYMRVTDSESRSRVVRFTLEDVESAEIITPAAFNVGWFSVTSDGHVVFETGFDGTRVLTPDGLFLDLEQLIEDGISSEVVDYGTMEVTATHRWVFDGQLYLVVRYAYPGSFPSSIREALIALDTKGDTPSVRLVYDFWDLATFFSYGAAAVQVVEANRFAFKDGERLVIPVSIGQEPAGICTGYGWSDIVFAEINTQGELTFRGTEGAGVGGDNNCQAFRYNAKQTTDVVSGFERFVLVEDLESSNAIKLVKLNNLTGAVAVAAEVESGMTVRKLSVDGTGTPLIHGYRALDGADFMALYVEDGGGYRFEYVIQTFENEPVSIIPIF